MGRDDPGQGGSNAVEHRNRTVALEIRRSAIRDRARGVRECEREDSQA